MTGGIQRRGFVELAAGKSGHSEERAASSEEVDGVCWYIESLHKAKEAEKIGRAGAHRNGVVAMSSGFTLTGHDASAGRWENPMDGEVQK